VNLLPGWTSLISRRGKSLPRKGTAGRAQNKLARRWWIDPSRWDHRDSRRSTSRPVHGRFAEVLAVEDVIGVSFDHVERLVHASFNGSIHLRVPLSAQLLRGLQPEFVSGGISTIDFKPEGTMLSSLVWEDSPALLIWAILEE
jgi:hypothetical protein